MAGTAVHKYNINRATENAIHVCHMSYIKRPTVEPPKQHYATLC